MRLKPFFSYYGSKWRASKYYPAPEYDTIIEPFAGSACYSLLHHSKNVILYDIDPVISGVWDWLIHASESDVMNIPDKVGNISEIENPNAGNLVGFWFTKGTSAPAKFPRGWAKSGKWDRQYWGPEIKDRICRQLEHIRHWRVFNTSYESIKQETSATWFIDPPYLKQGKHYVFNNIDYHKLGEWCLNRNGQIIVCEQEGADWLPFKPFKSVRTLRAVRSSEVVYTLETEPWEHG